MNPDFWTTILTFPTVLFTVMLGVLLLYWVFVIIGALDLDIFTPDAEVDADLDLEPDASAAGFTDLLSSLGLGGVPFMIVLSLLVFFAWMLSVPATAYLVLTLPNTLAQLLMALLVLAGSLLGSLLITAQLVRPLRQIFSSQSSVVTRDRLAGKLCTITTSRVNEHFGQAQFNDGGAGLILSVRADTPNTLRKGSQAVILEYNAVEDSYWVAEF